ncbi:unnamed protein product [Paramecium octaurelia]|uniref:Uncharacterized protein n=1 Tax=Paramecium octaurelia TaxID=43137 RepID=A0A8S1UE80_PAROT|nr:unnamed protein product [Paramecium octaurelia]
MDKQNYLLGNNNIMANVNHSRTIKTSYGVEAIQYQEKYIHDITQYRIARPQSQTFIPLQLNVINQIVNKFDIKWSNKWKYSNFYKQRINQNQHILISHKQQFKERDCITSDISKYKSQVQPKINLIKNTQMGIQFINALQSKIKIQLLVDLIKIHQIILMIFLIYYANFNVNIIFEISIVRFTIIIINIYCKVINQVEIVIHIRILQTNFACMNFHYPFYQTKQKLIKIIQKLRKSHFLYKFIYQLLPKRLCSMMKLNNLKNIVFNLNRNPYSNIKKTFKLEVSINVNTSYKCQHQFLLYQSESDKIAQNPFWYEKSSTMDYLLMI